MYYISFVHKLTLSSWHVTSSVFNWELVEQSTESLCLAQYFSGRFKSIFVPETKANNLMTKHYTVAQGALLNDKKGISLIFKSWIQSVTCIFLNILIFNPDFWQKKAYPVFGRKEYKRSCNLHPGGPEHKLSHHWNNATEDEQDSWHMPCNVLHSHLQKQPFY